MLVETEVEGVVYGLELEVRGSSIVVVAGKRRDFEGDGERERKTAERKRWSERLRERWR